MNFKGRPCYSRLRSRSRPADRSFWPSRIRQNTITLCFNNGTKKSPDNSIKCQNWNRSTAVCLKVYVLVFCLYLQTVFMRVKPTLADSIYKFLWLVTIQYPIWKKSFWDFLTLANKFLKSWVIKTWYNAYQLAGIGRISLKTASSYGSEWSSGFQNLWTDSRSPRSSTEWIITNQKEY